MPKRRNEPITARKHPLPDMAIQRNARHGKTASHLPETGELPIETLEKQIPKTDLHDM